MLYDAVDNWCSTGRFDLVDEFITSLIPEKMNTNMIVGVLTITKRAEPHLPHRSDFVRAVRQHLERIETSERVEALLKGLE
jgi:hypothetical protein